MLVVTFTELGIMEDKRVMYILRIKVQGIFLQNIAFGECVYLLPTQVTYLVRFHSFV